ncbi:hypothetical protein ACWFQT_20385, partial [Cellulosimicrobium cellulans]
LTAPQIARRLTRGTGPHLFLAALTGALLLVLADLAAQQVPWFDSRATRVSSRSGWSVRRGRAEPDDGRRP